jgi:hypothetical protein
LLSQQITGEGGTSAKEALEGLNTVDLTGQNSPEQAGQSQKRKKRKKMKAN